MLTALTIIGHELAHYLTAAAVGAQDLSLHWADVTFLEDSIGNLATAAIWAAGPLFNHVIILWALLSRSSHVAVLALGLGACSRHIVILPFTIKSLAGQDVSTFTNDEVTVASALSISATPLGVLTVTLGVTGLVIVLMRAFRAQGIAGALALFVGCIAGIALWSFVGPVLLPGGKGLD
ncbi:MAG: hypothetical protein AAF092_15005 [Pseudomonadota bacterium]